VIRPIVAAVKIVASAITIGFGGSVGREGPIIQIGASMGSAIGQWLRFSPQRLRTLIGCGAAAGIAATFNAPIAGALFAVEIILRDFAIVTFSPIIVASVLATVVSRHFLGNVPSFPVPAFSIGSWQELPAYLVLGLIVGVASVVYVRTLYSTEQFFDRLKFPFSLKPMLGGIPLGILLIWFPQVYGIGYSSMVEALSGGTAWTLMLAWSWSSWWRSTSRSARAPRAASSRRRCSWAECWAGRTAASSPSSCTSTPAASRWSAWPPWWPPRPAARSPRS
jgi:CIC family chloride channel protein